MVTRAGATERGRNMVNVGKLAGSQSSRWAKVRHKVGKCGRQLPVVWGQKSRLKRARPNTKTDGAGCAGDFKNINSAKKKLRQDGSKTTLSETKDAKSQKAQKDLPNTEN